MSNQGYPGNRPTGYGGPPPPQGSGYGGPPPPQGSGYGQPPQQGSGYGGRPPPPPSQSGYGGPPPPQGSGFGQGYNQNPGYGQQRPQGYGAQGGFGQQQGYGAAPPPPPRQQQANGPNPQISQQELYFWFQAVDTDRSGALDATELQRALINGDWSPFSIDTVRLMMTMFDRDMSGTIDFQEFAGLWRYIEDWKKCFRTFDRDGSGTIDRSELLGALTAFGFRVSQQVIDILIKKMDMLDGVKNKKGRGDIGFDRFIYACVTVKTLSESFRALDTNNDGWVELNYDSFLMMSITNKI
ncbi:Programmed cell death protein 6 [Smittium culicis]|uniref:Programmed cell death protein 6 n=1 Tax=Smittium culicis TaxID=133412 RepID=A0A1R1YJH9_9FUNG|nr:Programmed cell death protein 6 [Smittium culicis]